MKIPVALLAMAMAVGVVSCNSAPTQTSDNTIKPDDNGAVATNPGKAGNGNRMEGDAPAADSQFTIFCDSYGGPNHVLTATAMKERLIGETGLHNWHILHTNEQSTIFYGYYRTFDDKDHDPQETARAQADMKRIEAVKNVQKDRMFPKAMFLPINNPDPDAPPQWNLARTPSTAYWSLQIAAFRGFPERKQAAIEAVRKARSEGVEAYYYHGETISSVCIGAWPIDAVKRQELTAGGTDDSRSTIFVLSGTIGPIDSNMHDREGNPVQVQAPKLEILDPTMAEAVRKYPEHAVNYEVLVKTARNGVKVPSPSFLVLVPHNEGPPAPIIPLPPVPKISASSAADQATGAILGDSKPDQPGRGKLPSLDQP